MTERDPRLKQCASCDNWSGKSNIVGKCAICMNGKGFNVSCDCEIDGCFACEYEDDEDEEEIEGLDDTTEHDREMARVLTSGIRHCTQCNAQIGRLSVDDHCSSCVEK